MENYFNQTAIKRGFTALVLMAIFTATLPISFANAQMVDQYVPLNGGESIILNIILQDMAVDIGRTFGVRLPDRSALNGYTLYARVRANNAIYSCDIGLELWSSNDPPSPTLFYADTIWNRWSEWVSYNPGSAPMVDTIAVFVFGKYCYGYGDIDLELYLDGPTISMTTPTATTAITHTLPPPPSRTPTSPPPSRTPTFPPSRTPTLPPASRTPTSLPTLTRTSAPTTTSTQQPSQTAAPSRTPSPLPSAEFDLWADDTELTVGQCTTLYWAALNASFIVVDGIYVEPEGNQEVCPTQTTTYTMSATGYDGLTRYKDLTIYVQQPTATRFPSQPPTLTPVPRPTSTSIPTATVTQAPPPPCPPDVGAHNYILFITHSSRLDRNLGTPGAWINQFQPMLEELYTQAAKGCLGKPYFLDLAETYGDQGFVWSGAKSVLTFFIWQDMGGLLPGAITIIGGPDVVPMGELYNTADTDILYTDDLYADFAGGLENGPDVVITRLPDGHSAHMLKNYISMFDRQRLQPGTTLFTSLVNGGLNQYATYFEYPSLNAILPMRGPVAILSAPPYLAHGYQSGAFPGSDELIPPHETSLNELYAHQELLINLGGDGINTSWWTPNPTNGKIENAFDVKTVLNLPGNGGWHVFSLAGYSALLSSGVQRPENSIPLAFLLRGAHHFIGSTTAVYLVRNHCQQYPQHGFSEAICHMGLNNVGGLLVQYYYRVSSPDPAVSFWRAKSSFHQNMPDDHREWKTLQSFQYYGLVKPGPYLGTMTKVQMLSDAVLFHSKLVSCPSRNTGDCDNDGISEEEETWIANTFVPDYYLAQHEMAPKRAFVFQVSPKMLPDPVIKNGVVLTIAALYDQDYVIWNGKLSWDRLYDPLGIGPVALIRSYALEDGTRDFMHYGDDEAIEIWLSRTEISRANAPGLAAAHYRNQVGYNYYQVERVVAHRHGGAHVYGVEDFDWNDNTHPMVYISEGKHATFAKPNECLVSNLEGAVSGITGGKCHIKFGWGIFKDIGVCAFNLTVGRVWSQISSLWKCDIDLDTGIAADLGKCAIRVSGFQYDWEQLKGTMWGVFVDLPWHEYCSNASESQAAGKHTRPYLYADLNVGEVGYEFFIKMEENPRLATLYPGEQVWKDQNTRFCGGYRLSANIKNPFAAVSIPVIENLPGADKLLSDKICGNANHAKWCGTGSGYCANP